MLPNDVFVRNLLPVEIMPSYMQSISEVFLLTYLSEGLIDVMIFKYLEGIYINKAVIAVLAIVLSL